MLLFYSSKRLNKTGLILEYAPQQPEGLQRQRGMIYFDSDRFWLWDIFTRFRRLYEISLFGSGDSRAGFGYVCS